MESISTILSSSILKTLVQFSSDYKIEREREEGGSERGRERERDGEVDVNGEEESPHLRV